ncbi:MAG: amidohydrolase family protein [Pseudomonadota bacterium]
MSTVLSSVTQRFSAQRLITASITCGALVFGLSGAWADSTATQVTVYKAARLFDSVSGQLQEPGVLVIAGHKIQSVGPASSIPNGAKVVDLGEATLMPGFIDAHVHLSEESGPNWYLDFFNGMLRFPAEQALYGAHYAKATVEAGVTTVRDVGSSEYLARSLRNAINAGIIPGPRMLVSNYAIGSTGGHADQSPFPPEKIAVATPIKGVCNGPEECRAAVRYQIKFGADVIKMIPSGGVLSLSDPVDNVQMTQEEMNAAVAEAHAWGRKVAAHCHGDKAAKMAIAAGVDSIEHGSFLADDTLASMKAHHIYLVPTIFAGYWVGVNNEKFPPAIGVKARAAAEQIQQMFQHAAKIGVPVAMGTDAGVEPHGMNANEFWLMTKNGFSPSQALMAGTAGGADLLGLADQIGTLTPGKVADVIALQGNPLADIHATEHPVLVLRDGVEMFRKSP